MPGKLRNRQLSIVLGHKVLHNWDVLRISSAPVSPGYVPLLWVACSRQRRRAANHFFCCCITCRVAASTDRF